MEKKMQSTEVVIEKIIARFKKNGYAQGPINRFGFVSQSVKHVVISRERGKNTPIPFNKIDEAIIAVRKDHKVYSEGPTRLGKHGLTHITSPLWALINLLTLGELKS